MTQSLKNYISKEYQVRIQTAAPTGTFTVGEVVMNGANLGASTAFGVLKAIEGSGGTTELIVDSIGGVEVSGTAYGSTVLFVDGDTVTGNTSAATAVIDTVVGDADGADIKLTARGIERIRKIGSRVVSEVLVGLKHFSHRFEALKDFDVPPTFSGVPTFTVDVSLVTGEVITLTLTATDDVSVVGAPIVVLDINGTLRDMVYSSGDSTSTSLVFKYTAVAEDVALAGEVSIGTAVVGGTIYQISTQDSKVYQQNIGVSFAEVDVSTVTFN